jgi:hypothetical protein
LSSFAPELAGEACACGECRSRDDTQALRPADDAGGAVARGIYIEISPRRFSGYVETPVRQHAGAGIRFGEESALIYPIAYKLMLLGYKLL